MPDLVKAAAPRGRYIIRAFIGVSVLAGAYLSRRYSYLFFHSVAEIFSVVVAGGIFMFAYNARRFLQNDYLKLLGVAFLFVGAIDIVHTLAYKGMGIFRQYGDTNLPAQLWMTARFMQGASFLIAPFFFKRRLRMGLVFGVYAAAFVLAIALIFGRIFPDCYIEGVGLTPFKIIGEYVIIVFLLAAMILLRKNRGRFEDEVFRLLILSLIITIASELVFSMYLHAYDHFNFLGHVFKIAAFYFLYRAIVETGLLRPYELFFRELKRSERMLEEKARALERTNRELERFAYVVSHDLKEPLSTVGGFARLLGRRYAGGLDAKGREFLSFIIEGTGRMEALIKDILAFSRAGRRGPLEDVDTEAVLEKALANLGMAIEEAGATITRDKLYPVKADPSQLVQLFQNLISNAIKYRSDRPPRIHVSMRKTTGLAQHAQNEEVWLFSFSDNGIGIKPGDHERIFQVFERLRQRDEAGTGIGLAICKKIVERHGGRIWLESAPGEGSTFYFTIAERLAEEKEKEEAEYSLPMRAG